MKYKIDGEPYDLLESAPDAPDAYAKRGKILDEQPRGKVLGYLYMDDGSCIECYKAFNWLIVIIPLILLILIGGGLLFWIFTQPKDFVIPGSEVIVKQGDDQTIIRYNGFTTVEDGNLDINFENGAEECKITITGDGMETVETMVAPYGTVEFLPVNVTTDEGLIVATMTLTTATSTVTNEIAIELPDNYTPDSVDGSLDNYWKGEYIYGVPASE